MQGIIILISSSWSRVLSDEVYALVTSQEVNEIRPLRREGTLSREISNLFALNFEFLNSFLHSNTKLTPRAPRGSNQHELISLFSGALNIFDGG